MGALEASRDTETGQEASRAAPVPEPMAERGARAAMAGQGTREAMADQGIRDAMVVQSAWAAMADQGILWPWPLAWPHRPWLYGPPKKKNSWGSSPLGAVQEERALWGVLEAWTLGGTREARTLGGAREARAQLSAFEELALEGTCEE